MSIDVSQFVHWVQQGNIIAYPTDTLWGFGVDAQNPEAVQKLIQLKDRDQSKPISLLLAHADQAEEWVDLHSELRKFLHLVWPGPITLVLPLASGVKSYISGDSGMIGLRCLNHPFVSEFYKNFKGYLTTTSVNRSGDPPATKFEDLDWVPEEVLKVPWKEELPFQKGSTVIAQKDSKNWTCLRQGAVDLPSLQKTFSAFGWNIQ